MPPAILVVDDNRLARQNIAGFLVRNGYAVTEAETGEHAIQVIRDIDHFDVVITDLRMPGSINGLDVLEYQAGVSPGRCAILITAFGSDQIREQAEALGAVYMDKPIRLNQLLERIQSYKPAV
jgi:CheY-like chemotaxis protein